MAALVLLIKDATFIIPPHSVTGRETVCQSHLTVGDAPIDRPPIIIRHFSVTADQLVLPEKAKRSDWKKACPWLWCFQTLYVSSCLISVCIAATENPAVKQNLLSYADAEIEPCNRHSSFSCRLLKNVVKSSSGTRGQSSFQQLTNPSWNQCL